MSAEPEKEPFSESNLESPEYRKRLKRKLNTLIAVLEVACAKVRRSLAGPNPDLERLTRIYKNLRETLQVCTRARTALDNHEALPPDLPEHLKLAGSQKLGEAFEDHDAPASAGTLRSESERKRFARLGPIDPREIRSCDLDALCSRLLGA